MKTYWNQIIFNSGASESISTFMNSIHIEAQEKSKRFFIISSIEHASVHKMAEYYQKIGLELKFLPVNSEGIVNIDILNSFIYFHYPLSILSVLNPLEKPLYFDISNSWLKMY